MAAGELAGRWPDLVAATLTACPSQSSRNVDCRLNPSRSQAVRILTPHASHKGSLSHLEGVQELERILDDDNDMADMYLGRRRHLEALEDITNPTSPRRMPSGIRKEDFFGSAVDDDVNVETTSKRGPPPKQIEPISVPVVGDLDPRHRTFTDHSHTQEMEFRREPSLAIADGLSARKGSGVTSRQ